MRDGWRCRYCGVRVVSRHARKIISDQFPETVLWPDRDKEKYGAFYALLAVADHVVPHTLGGPTAQKNLVTACQSCNYGKVDYLFEEIDLLDPRFVAPFVDGWDGLDRLSRHAFGNIRAVTAGHINQMKRSRKPVPLSDHEAWFPNLDRIEQGLSDRILTLLADCGEFGVSWGLREVLIIRQAVGPIKMQVCGIESDGRVHIPWAIGDQKTQFCAFADTISAAVPDARTRETPRQWLAEKNDIAKINVQEILAASTALRIAFRDLATAVKTSEPAGADLVR